MRHTPRPHQQELLDSIKMFLRSHKRFVVQSPTGSGKGLVIDYTSEMFEKVAILTHRAEIYKQLENGTTDVWMTKTINNRPEEVIKYDTFLIDECHHRDHAQTLKKIPMGATVIGFTATPIYSGKNWIGNDYQAIITGKQVAELVGIGILCPLRILDQPLNGRDSLKIDSKTGDFQQGQQFDLFNRKLIQNSLIANINKHCEGRMKFMHFCSSKKHVKATATLLRETYPDDVVLELVSDSGANRDEIIDTVKICKKRVHLVNIEIATTGTDIPAVDVLVILFATQSLSKWIQVLGRGARTFEGKEDCIVLDMGQNKEFLGDYMDIRDWKAIFEKDPSKKEAGEMPEKVCDSCHALCPLTATECPECGAEFIISKPKEMGVVLLEEQHHADRYKCVPNHTKYSKYHTLKEAIEVAEGLKETTLPLWYPSRSVVQTIGMQKMSFLEGTRYFYKGKGSISDKAKKFQNISRNLRKDKIQEYIDAITIIRMWCKSTLPNHYYNEDSQYWIELAKNLMFDKISIYNKYLSISALIKSGTPLETLIKYVNYTPNLERDLRGIDTLIKFRSYVTNLKIYRKVVPSQELIFKGVPYYDTPLDAIKDAWNIQR